MSFSWKTLKDYYNNSYRAAAIPSRVRLPKNRFFPTKMTCRVSFKDNLNILTLSFHPFHIPFTNPLQNYSKERHSNKMQSFYFTNRLQNSFSLAPIKITRVIPACMNIVSDLIVMTSRQRLRALLVLLAVFLGFERHFDLVKGLYDITS